MAPDVEEKESTKRAEAQSIIERLEHWKEIASVAGNGGSVDVKWMIGSTLHYNMWIKNRGKPSEEANLSVYFYSGRDATPAIRSDSHAHDLIESMGKEFEYVWTRAASSPSF